MQNLTEPVQVAPPAFHRMQRAALIVGIVGLALCAVGAFISPEPFFRSYLVGYLFWIGIALGCLVIASLHRLAGGAWGVMILRLAEAGASTLPLMAALFLPLVFGLGHLYLWARPEAVAHDALLQYKSVYLNVPFFVARTVVYLVTWIVITHYLIKWSHEFDRTADVQLFARMRRFSAISIVFFAVTVTFAMIDWLMSLEPHWYSTMYAAMVASGQVLAAFAFVITAAALLADRPPLSEVQSPRLFNDLGSLLLAFVMIWAYLSFSQYMLIWSGNLSEEIPWYLRRLQGGWEWVALVVTLFSFVLPFSLLLSRELKRSRMLLAMVAALLMVMRLVDLFWLVTPAFDEAGPQFHWLYVITPIGIGGLWLAAFIRHLSRYPLLPRHELRVEEHEQLAHEPG